MLKPSMQDFKHDLTSMGDKCKFIFSSFSFSKPNENIRKFLVHIMLKPSMKDFKHDLTSMGEEYNCLMVSTFFGITHLGNWDED